MRVAVKTPKRESDSNERQMQRDLLRDEMKILAYLQEILPDGHENVLKLIGANTSSIDHFCILTDYCEWGSLDNFLRNKTDNDQYVNEIVSGDSDSKENSARHTYRVIMSE